jgi:hypothetical protein
MNFRDIGLPKQECTQDSSNPHIPSATSFQETKHHSNCVAPTIDFHSTADMESILNTTSSKAIFHPADIKDFYDQIEVPKAPISPPGIRRSLATTTPNNVLLETSRTKTALPDCDENELVSASLINNWLCDTSCA